MYNSRKNTTTSHGSLKIKLLGKDGAPLSLRELKQALYETAQRLAPYEESYRAKSATLYLNIVDRDGTPTRLEKTGEWKIFPYRSIADEEDDSPSHR